MPFYFTLRTSFCSPFPYLYLYYSTYTIYCQHFL
nr:MAG TPA: hypothetical protein [Caudoviricetes sp.]